jgi:hypothetical protein
MHIGAKIRQLRRRQGLTQQDIEAKTGVMKEGITEGFEGPLVLAFLCRRCSGRCLWGLGAILPDSYPFRETVIHLAALYPVPDLISFSVGWRGISLTSFDSGGVSLGRPCIGPHVQEDSLRLCFVLSMSLK